MADLKLDDEFGSALAGAGSKPAFANLVRFRAKDATQKEFPTTLTLTRARVEVDVPLNQSSEPASGPTPGVKCFFRIGNEFFATDRFVPAEGCWEGAGEIRFMLASNVIMQVKILTADPPEKPLGYARLRLGRVGEGEFSVDGEVKRSEDVAPEDKTVGRITISFKVSPNFTIQLSKLDSQYDTVNIPTLINIISVDSKTLGHRMGAFQGALQILQSIITDLQSQGAIGSVTAKQLGAILNQASSAQGIELFEDLLWDLAYLSFATEVFQPSLTFFPGTKTHAAAAGSLQGAVDASAATIEGRREISFDKLAVLAELARHPHSFALVRDTAEPVILVAETDADLCRWTAALHIACEANSEFDEDVAKKLVIPEYCKDSAHPDRPTVGWMRRKKKDKKLLTSSFVRRFFSLTCDESAMRYTFSYGKEPGNSAGSLTNINIDEGTRLLLPNTPPVPTPFALQIAVQKVSDFSFSESEELHVVAQLGTQTQCTQPFNPRETTAINSTLLLPVEKESLKHAHPSVMTSNIGWFGEEVDLASHPSSGDKKVEIVSFFVESETDAKTRTALGTCSIPFSQIRFGRQEDMTLTLEGHDAKGAELFVGVTMRRLGQYKTAWPAMKTNVLLTEQVPGADADSGIEKHLWEGPCLVRTAPQGLEVFSPAVNPDEPNTPMMTIDYYSVEAVTNVNDSTLDIAVIIDEQTTQPVQPQTADRIPGSLGVPPPTPLISSPFPGQAGYVPPSPGKVEGDSQLNLGSPRAAFDRLDLPPPPRRRSVSRRGSFGMVTRKGRSLSIKPPGRPVSLPTHDASGAAGGKVVIPHDYFILRISPCPAETLKELTMERQWMTHCRNMLLYITHKLHNEKIQGNYSVDRGTREKLAVASSETYKVIRTDMDEIIKTSDWRKARGVGFTEKHIRMFFRLQRLSVYFAKLLESNAHPLWGFDDPIDPRGFAREDLDKIFASQYVQSGAFGAEAQGIENSVKGVGWALKALHRRLDEVKLFYHNSAEDIVETSRIFVQEYFLRCTGELGAHLMFDEVLREVPIEVVVAFVCFLVKRDNAFHGLLVDNSLEPNLNIFLTSILSINSMIKRLTKRTELEIVAQWPKEGDIGDNTATAYVTSLLGDCSPDMENDGKLSTRAPEELMVLLVSRPEALGSQLSLGKPLAQG